MSFYPAPSIPHTDLPEADAAVGEREEFYDPRDDVHGASVSGIVGTGAFVFYVTDHEVITSPADFDHADVVIGTWPQPQNDNGGHFSAG